MDREKKDFKEITKPVKKKNVNIVPAL